MSAFHYGCDWPAAKWRHFAPGLQMGRSGQSQPFGLTRNTGIDQFTRYASNCRNYATTIVEHSLPLVPVEFSLLGPGGENAQFAVGPVRLVGENVGDEQREAPVVEQPPHVDEPLLLLPVEPANQTTDSEHREQHKPARLEFLKRNFVSFCSVKQEAVLKATAVRSPFVHGKSH